MPQYKHRGSRQCHLSKFGAPHYQLFRTTEVQRKITRDVSVSVQNLGQFGLFWLASKNYKQEKVKIKI